MITWGRSVAEAAGVGGKWGGGTGVGGKCLGRKLGDVDFLREGVFVDLVEI